MLITLFKELWINLKTEYSSNLFETHVTHIVPT